MEGFGFTGAFFRLNYFNVTYIVMEDEDLKPDVISAVGLVHHFVWAGQTYVFQEPE